MNEEENRKGPGVFYAVVGVATLVVAIIGATFAYFSASVTPDENSTPITGDTSDIGASTITLTVNKVNLGGTASGDLVPAVISTADTTGINAATAKKCEEGGYTGCHVYEITAQSENAISSADLLLNLSTNATTGTNWKYVVYQGTAATAATGITTPTAAMPAVNVDILSTPGLTAATPVTYYLMVYLENINSVQNDGVTENTTSETGRYTGTVTLQAAGNQVKANLS